MRWALWLAVGLTAAGCAGSPGTHGRPLHAPANFDPSMPGFVACSRLIVEGDVISVTASGSRMITELNVDEWVKPSSGPRVARIESADIAAQGAYEHWRPGTHLFLQVGADPSALPNWQFNQQTIDRIKAAVPQSRSIDCPYGLTDVPLVRSS
jgi:hypothetical protein